MLRLLAAKPDIIEANQSKGSALVAGPFFLGSLCRALGLEIAWNTWTYPLNRFKKTVIGWHVTFRFRECTTSMNRKSGADA
jgi:hypothetical protein